MTLRQARREFEANYIMEALERNNWNQSKTAKEIGMHRNNIIFKINALGLRDRIQAKTGRPANEKAEA